VTTAAAIVSIAIWAGPATIAAMLGATARSRTTTETGRPETVAARPSLEWACALAGAGALLFAWLITR
jgi:hypothetical protein